ncbi:TPA: hypothetical protein RY759_002328 [Staphylococcus aureus]|nr:hypothetical protein [Staphylococcus aureus]MBH4598610.1 hypothetical protein [Staphylococcus aureus]HDG8500873.1 hypothetical protein [Staphylococcus aureus]HDG8588263.1 hypothetical protein [Staphylococcus aureus]HDZ3299500.1 hypothetical protein [Staphylococcus aureus]
MKINFNENGVFLFQGKEYLDSEYIQYKLASLELGEQVSILSTEDINFYFLEKVQLKGIKLIKDNLVITGKVSKFNK